MLDLPLFDLPTIFGGLTIGRAPGYTLDLDASKGTYQDVAGTTPATADTNPVKLWQDQSGNGYHVSEATTNPLLKTNLVNGYPVVRFDGSNDVLSNAGFAARSDNVGTFYIVAANASPANDCMVAVSDTATTNNFLMFQTRETPPVFAFYSASPTNTIYEGPDQIGTDYRIYEFASNGSLWDQVIDGTTQVLVQIAGTNVGHWIGDVSGRDTFMLGALPRTTVSQWWKGDIARVLYYSQYHDAGTRSQVRALLAAQYGIAIP